MLDINFIKNNREIVIESMKNRNFKFDIDELIQLDEKRREIMTKTQQLQSRKNELAKEIGSIKSGKIAGDINIVMKLSEEVKFELESLEKQDSESQDFMKQKLEMLPNILQSSVPIGATEDENIVIKTHGEKPIFAFKPKEHNEIGEKSGMMDFENARKISGSRFVILRNGLAKLERALANFMLDTHISDFRYQEISVPVMVNENSMYGTGQLPKFDNGYQTTDGMYLIPTSEVPVTNIVNSEIVDINSLPMRFCCHSQCFRSEAGSAGKDVTGMIRQHQFSKVELVSIVHPEKSEEEHERMLAAAENILQKLELHYRISLLCSGDTGFSSSKTYDIEVWLAGQGRYCEISSCSNMRDFQARRMMARYKDGDKKGYLHTLNGTGLAIGRTMVAIIENYQNEDGSINIPKVLVSYMGGVEVVG